VTHKNRMGGKTMVIRQVSFRRWARTGDFPALTVQHTMKVGHGTVAPGKMSTVWGNNYTGKLTTVFQGTINLPAVKGGTLLHPWTVTIKFSQPFVYQPTMGHFVCDWQCIAPATSASWYRDARYVKDTANTPSYVYDLGAGCPGSNRRFPTISLAQPTGAVPGSSMTVGLTSADPSVTVALSVLGLQWQSPFPIDLSATGAIGCWLYTDLFLVAPLTVANGTGQASWPLPNITGLGGAVIATQMFLFDKKANAFGVAASNGLRVTLGNLPVGAGNWATDTIYALTANAATGIKVTLDYGVIMRLN